jgi:anti-sigma factor RsiW
MRDWLRFRRHPIGEQELSAYLDGQLSPAQNRRLEEHLSSCAACRRKLDDLRTLVEALHALPEAAAPRSFALTPEQAVPTPLLAGGLYLAFRNAAAAALVLLFASIGADIFLQFHGEPGQPETGMLGAQGEGEFMSPLAQGSAAADEATGELEAFDEKEAVPLPAVPEQATPANGVSPSAEETVPSTTADLATPETARAAEVGEEEATPSTVEELATPETAGLAEAVEEEGDRVWLRALEGALGVIVLGFIAAAFWVRRRPRHT